MRLIPGTTVKMVEQCCGHDGTWAMRKEFFPLSLLYGKKAFDQMQAAEAKVMATDCPLAAIHFQQAIGQRPIHPCRCSPAPTALTVSPKPSIRPRRKRRTMKPIEVSEIKHIADYEILRSEWRPQIMALKNRRRIRVGAHMMFLFENRETVLYQIQEMMRIERLQSPARDRARGQNLQRADPGGRRAFRQLVD